MFKKEIKEYNYTKEELETFKYAKIKTKKGEIVLNLFYDATPNTVSNFVSLAKDGFYDGLNFHRVIPDFMAQGGCPEGSGMGGPNWAIKCETDASKQDHKRGSLSMAHAGKDTGGSQFFICFVPCSYLNKVHTVFGEIQEGDEESFKNLDSIKQGDKIVSIEILESLN